MSEKDYLNNGEWMRPLNCAFCEAGVVYTYKRNVKNLKVQMMKEKGITDTNAIKVEPFPEPEKIVRKATRSDKKQYPEADYIAELKFENKVKLVPIKIPQSISQYHIRVDTTEGYITKTIYPKVAGQGMTAVYIKKINSSFDFNLIAKNLSFKDQQLALRTFKSIKFK